MLEIPNWLKAYYNEPMNSVAPKASPKANGAPMSWSAMPIADLKCYSDMLALLHREELRQLVYTYEAYRTALLVELRDRQARGAARDVALDSLWVEVGRTGAELLEGTAGRRCGRARRARRASRGGRTPRDGTALLLRLHGHQCEQLGGERRVPQPAGATASRARVGLELDVWHH